LICIIDLTPWLIEAAARDRSNDLLDGYAAAHYRARLEGPQIERSRGLQVNAPAHCCAGMHRQPRGRMLGFERCCSNKKLSIEEATFICRLTSELSGRRGGSLLDGENFDVRHSLAPWQDSAHPELWHFIAMVDPARLSTKALACPLQRKLDATLRLGMKGPEQGSGW
jgi:hypothetical protein